MQNVIHGEECPYVFWFFISEAKKGADVNMRNAIPYDNLIWHQRFFDSGEWSLRTRAEAFALSFGYGKSQCGAALDYVENNILRTNIMGVTLGGIAMNGSAGKEHRKDIGLIQAVKYSEDDDTVELSGFFMDKMADYIVSQHQITSGGTAVSQSNSVVSVAADVLNKITNVKVNSLYTKTYGWNRTPLKKLTGDTIAVSSTGNTPLAVDFGPTSFGKKVREWCEPRNYGMFARYFKNATDEWDYYLDLRHSNDFGSTSQMPVTFSDTIGNASNIVYSLDYSGWANTAVNATVFNNDVYKTRTQYAPETYSPATVIDSLDKDPSDYDAMAVFLAYRKTECETSLGKNNADISITFDVADATGYGSVWNVGDIVCVRVAGKVFDVQISEVTETWKAGSYDMTLDLGTPRVSNINKAVGRAIGA